MKSQPKGKAFASMATEEAEEWLNKDPKVSPMYQSFLKKFGHRCLREVGVIEYFFLLPLETQSNNFTLIAGFQQGEGQREREERDRERQREAERDTLTHKACTQRKREESIC